MKKESMDQIITENLILLLAGLRISQLNYGMDMMAAN